MLRVSLVVFGETRTVFVLLAAEDWRLPPGLTWLLRSEMRLVEWDKVSSERVFERRRLNGFRLASELSLRSDGLRRASLSSFGAAGG